MNLFQVKPNEFVKIVDLKKVANIQIQMIQFSNDWNY